MRPSLRSATALLAILLTALAAGSRQLSAQSATAQHDYTKGDVAFMQGMIMHHAQAVVMSNLAPTHDADSRVAVICKRIALSQIDEINLMQHWLADRHLDVPDPLHMRDGHHGPVHDTSPMDMPGMDMGHHPMMMEGMLSPAEMRQLEASRGNQFDHLYLTGMIKHHTGALGMVAALFATPGSGQQADVFNFASEIDAGQRAEIGRMEALLKVLPPLKSR